ncbi:hypothetical protein Ga0466249_001518 [Sporomusaceae bacterium BoRhaA]|uniref:hypothetical protein n=1 Tax=Pelorhabdus rhamnosifermentans TaxID=2772457 RepID=UPI001C05FFF6|nr:hypothetical protein [Pelorhabdus rhamnosifermentans]MBU2700426.1 hypothetical protein [Pelorhabdus rhamnosifermentans]
MSTFEDSTVQGILQNAATQIAAYIKGSNLAETIGINNSVGGVVALSTNIGIKKKSDGYTNWNARVVSHVDPLTSSSGSN